MMVRNTTLYLSTVTITTFVSVVWDFF